MVPASLDSQWVKGDILQYCRGLTASIDNNHALVEQHFHSALQGNEKLTIHTATWRFCLLEKHLKKDSLQPRWKGLYQVPLTNPCAAKLQGVTLGYPCHLKKATPDWNCTLSDDLKLHLPKIKAGGL